MVPTNDGIVAQVFGSIATRFDLRRNDIAKFASTSYSFEEWLNWEAFLACSEHVGWTAFPKYQYKHAGIENCTSFADLLVSCQDMESSVLVEIKLAHDWTKDDYLTKIDNDRVKLAREFKKGIIPLQIIVSVSVGKIESHPIWENWFARSSCLQRPTELNRIVILPPSGEMIIRGWNVPAISGEKL